MRYRRAEPRWAAGLVILPRGRARGDQRPGWRIDWAGTFLVLGAVGLVCTALTEAPGWPPSRTLPVLAGGLLLGGAFVAHIRRHPDPLVAPRLFSARTFSAGAAGLVTYYTGFAAMLLGTTLLLAGPWHLSVLQAAVSIAPGPIMAGIVSPFAGRLSARFGTRNTVVAGAALFAAAGAAPRAELASGSAVLAMARQLGSALGVAILVTVLGARPATDMAGFDRAWIVVLVTAALTAVAGLAVGRRLIRFPEMAARAEPAGDALSISPARPAPSRSAAPIRE